MTYGAAIRDLLGALEVLVTDYRRVQAHLDRAAGQDPEARAQILAQATRLRTPVLRAVARMATFAAVEETRHDAQAAYEHDVAERAARTGARAGAALAAAVTNPRPGTTLARRIVDRSAAKVTEELARRDGTDPSREQIANALAKRTADRVTARVTAAADVSHIRRLAGNPTAGHLPAHAPATALASSARQLEALARSTETAALGDGDLLDIPVPVVAAWQTAARAAILLTERELLELGELSVEQRVTLTSDAALVRDALTLLDAHWRDFLRAAGHSPWVRLPLIPSDPTAARAGIDHLGHRPPAAAPPIGTRDGVDETLRTLGAITEGLAQATPHAKAAEQVAAALTRISHHVGAIGARAPTWSARTAALDSLWLELQDVQSGAGARHAAPLAESAVQELSAVTELDTSDEALLLEAVDHGATALRQAVAHAARTHLYTVVVDFRPGPVVRATRRLLPVHQFATDATAPKLFDALGAVAAATRHRPDTGASTGDDVAGQARARLAELVPAFGEATPRQPAPTEQSGLPPQVAKVYDSVRARIADGTYSGAIPSAAGLAHRHHTSSAAARQALAHLAADRVLVVNPPGRGPAATVTPGKRVTWATVCDRLRERIVDGTYAGKLPSTKALAAELGVSTTVVHTAAAALVRDGYVTRVRGPHGGTFTTSGPIPRPPAPKWRTIHADLSTQIAEGTLIGRLPAMSALADQYQVSVSTVHQAIVRLTADGVVYQRTGGTRSGTYVQPTADEADDCEWRHLYEALRTQITGGDLSGQLPTPATLARSHGVEPQAAARAVAHLVTDGLVGHRVGGDRRGLHVVPQGERERPARWRSIYADLCAQITGGAMTGRLPSRRDLARTYATSTGPPGQAIRQLADDGLITVVTGTGPTAGAYVATAPPPPPDAAIWTDVYDQIRARLDDGTYTGRLPGVRELAAAHHTTRAPVYKALRKLTAHGRTYTVNDGPRSGTYVADPGTQPVRSQRWTVYDDLRRRITNGALNGRPLTLEELASQYRSGRKPVRYAVARLADEGLLTTRSGKGITALTPAIALGSTTIPSDAPTTSGPSL